MGWREQFREDNELLLRLFWGYYVRRFYLAIAIWTFAFHVSRRWPECAGAVGCGLSFLKGAVWSLAWPFYWINYATGFVLVRPYG